ncbi:MAG: mannose-6-phosphate isomerase, class I [Actinobacteria bacterium]|nr:mannose-6-phosphate isomerase, class I [Actinomycetota bacterium]MBI3687838.1 mannose-6-phosphate isomerase, class I [Actinomycetota bacterium]
MYRLDNVVRPYPWGSTTAIPDLLGLPPTGQPQAELWMGAHPSAPSLVRGGGSLLDRITADPLGELGASALAAHGPRLPFLVKVLAAAQPLSIQAHPTAEQASAGFVAENARAVPLDAARRNYRDASHKPELVCALTPFRALAGFRSVPDTMRLLASLGVAELAPYVGVLRRDPGEGGLRSVVASVLTAGVDRRAGLVSAVAAGCRATDGEEFVEERRTVVELADRYPADPGVVIALLLNHLCLQPGDALFMPAGNLHAYLRGTAVEVMANSDNVLRGGLTGKHVDVPELLRVLDATAGPPALVLPRPRAGAEQVYPAPAREFRLCRLRLTGETSTLDGGQPQILLCVDGEIAAADNDEEPVLLARGQSAYLPASVAKITIGGTGTLFRVTPNLD